MHKTEQEVHNKWGPDADTQFCRVVESTTREEDQACDLKVDGDHAVATWNIKGIQPEKLIKVDGHWMSDIHGMWNDWIAQNPSMESDKHPLGPTMKQARTEIEDGKFDDVDSFVRDLRMKMNGNDN